MFLIGSISAPLSVLEQYPEYQVSSSPPPLKMAWYSAPSPLPLRKPAAQITRTAAGNRGYFSYGFCVEDLQAIDI